MKLHRHFSAMRILTTTILFSIVASCFGSNLPEELAQSDRFFGSSGTNAPLLELDWFSGPSSIEYCRVSQSGNVSSARNVINWAIQGGHRAQLDQTNLELLAAAMNSLPAPANQTLSKERLLVVRGLRTNQWFEFTYDRANVPKEVERVYEITGSYLEWFIPKVDGHLIAHTSYGGSSGSQAGIESFRIASAASIAVSSGVNGIQIWDLKKGTATPLLFLTKAPNLSFQFGQPWDPATISPDGSIIVCASDYVTFAADWKAEKVLWVTNALVQVDSGGCLTKKVAIGGDKGQFLFVAAAHKVERWDLATGKYLATLDTNRPTIQFLETSRDGNTLVAGFNDSLMGGCITMSTSISVWKSDEDMSSARFEMGSYADIGISPDGRKIALSIFGQNKLLLWSWQNGITNEITFRTPGSLPRAYAMFWSPDRTRFAAYVDTYPASIVVYDALNWKPLAHWECGQVMSDAKFDFASDGEFVELRDHDLTGLDVKSLTELK
jgi:WD40 repeat protein